MSNGRAINHDHLHSNDWHCKAEPDYWVLSLITGCYVQSLSRCLCPARSVTVLFAVDARRAVSRRLPLAVTQSRFRLITGGGSRP
eukprot:1952752-Rhodomonas_salina.1